jgi:hypothetical protein
MICPVCSDSLPFSFAFTSGLGKKYCPACKNSIMPTSQSMEKIQKFSVVLSFIAGIPLGAICSYLWIGALQFELAIFVFVMGVAGVIGSAYIYSKSHIKFHLATANS